MTETPMTPEPVKRPIEVEDLFRLKAISEAQFSPDGKTIVYGISHIDTAKEKQLNALWLYSLETGRNRPLTSGEGSDWGASWSPDGRQIAFLSARSGTPQVYVIPVGGGEAVQLTDFKQPIGGGPVWSPDGAQIAFTAGPNPQPLPSQGRGEGSRGTQEGLGDPKKPYRVNRSVYRSDGIGYLDPVVQDIYTVFLPSLEGRGEGSRGTQEGLGDPKKPYRVNRSVYRSDGIGYLDPVVQNIYTVFLPSLEGRDRGLGLPGPGPLQLTNDRFSNASPQWSPDGTRILFMALADPDSMNPDCRALKMVDLDGKVTEFLHGWGGFEFATWMPDGKALLFTGQEEGHPIGTKSDLWIYDLEKETVDCRTKDLKFGVGGGLRCDVPVSWNTQPRISADGKTAYVNVHQGGTLQIYTVALTGKESFRPLVQGERTTALLDTSAANLLFVESDFHNPCDLFICTLNGKTETRLTGINDDLLPNLELARVEHLLFPGVDGAQVEGWAMLPAKGEGPFPTVLYIHGGPHSAFGSVFNFDFLLLPARGYTCLLINHRASTGYGDEFSTAIKGDWGNLDYQDLMSGVDFAIGKGFVDPDKLGCTGISGGGNLSCWIVGHTDRFKAAMPENPVTNWVSFYGTSDIGVWFGVEELGGHPHEIPEVYRKCSPVTYAHHCKTPTLMVQGENDYRCPAGQSEEFYTILKANGCVAEMLRFPNSSHGGAITGGLPMRRAHREALLDWMDRYVMGKSR